MTNLVSAHTGNDLVNHGITIYDGIIGGILLVGLIIGIMFLIKYKRIRWQNKK